MSSAQLPRGAEHSYSGGVQTNAPLVAVTSIVLAYLISLLTLVPALGGESSAELVVVNGVLSGIAVALFAPTLQPGRQGRLAASHCEPRASFLRTHAVFCAGFTVILLFRHFTNPLPALFLLVPALFSGIGAHHLKQIRTALRTAEWKERHEDNTDIGSPDH